LTSFIIAVISLALMMVVDFEGICTEGLSVSIEGICCLGYSSGSILSEFTCCNSNVLMRGLKGSIYCCFDVSISGIRVFNCYFGAGYCCCLGAGAFKFEYVDTLG
jgi:hypothetical protein